MSFGGQEARVFERFSETARIAMFAARLEVTEAASDAIAPEHLLLGLLETRGGVAQTLAEAAGVSAEALRPRLLAAAPTPLPFCVEVPFAPAVKRALEAAVAEADAMDGHELTTGHLLLGLLRDEHSAVSLLLREAGLKLNAVRAAVQAHAAQGSEAKAPALDDVFNERIRRLERL
jgi:ATP-dependent Clp protease ATP-binding subunit ClpC